MSAPPNNGSDSQIHTNNTRLTTITSAIAHLSQVPWCKSMISDPAWTCTTTPSRTPKASSEDSFFAETLGTERTIRCLLTLRPSKLEDSEPRIREVRTIMDLGDGLNGHPRILHGGFVATMLDEVFGVLILSNLVLERESGGSVTSCFTAYLNTNYKRPVPAPGVVLCTAKFERKEGRKIYVRGSIEDGMGTVYSTGEGMFLETRAKI
ncbi:HotDog domain-containing protein [Clohesyomyces aquaticus]|uniref:HotDog domain-containing protein n=1 Tax=Clohesyomyces aquaticus TaxID=1231657 RepID=A0A1Y1YNG3_9PLEO|nr:HotDog domain-containing protein [Clohesyomyces aquaticus]